MKDKEKFFNLFCEIVGLALPILLFFCISIILSIGLLNLLGFEYTSISIVLFFFVTYTLSAFFIEPLVNIYVLTITEMGRLNKLVSEIVGCIFFIGFDIVIISFLEAMINGITISDRTIVLFSIITYICGKIMEELFYINTSETKDIRSSKKVKEAIEKKKSKGEEE